MGRNRAALHARQGALEGTQASRHAPVRGSHQTQAVGRRHGGRGRVHRDGTPRRPPSPRRDAPRQRIAARRRRRPQHRAAHRTIRSKGVAPSKQGARAAG